MARSTPARCLQMYTLARLQTTAILLPLLAGAPAHAALFLGAGCSIPNLDIQESDELVAVEKFAEANHLLTAALTRLAGNSARRHDPAIPCTMDRLANLHIRMGRLEEALNWSQRAVEHARLASPPQPAALLAANLAALHLELGDTSTAELWARYAMTTATESGPSYPLAITTLGAVYAHRADYVRAQPLFRQALSYVERAYGARHIEAAFAANNLAHIYRAQEQYSNAAEHYRKAIANFELSSGSYTWELLLVRAGLMVSCEYSFQSATAESLATALETTIPDLPSDDARVAALLHDLALVRAHRKDFPAARAFLERALTILESTYGPHSPRMIPALRTYAGILRAAHDKGAAKRTASRIKLLIRADSRNKRLTRAGEGRELPSRPPRAIIKP